MASLKSEDDQARFASVVLPHLADAYALARWLTGNRADAGDVVQEACLRAFRGIAGFAGVNARAWLLTIVRHAAYTWLGKNRSAALLVVDDLESIAQQQATGPGPAGEGPQTPEAALIAKADARRLETAIAELPVPFRETLVLRDVQGLDYREIAEVTKVPIGTVMSRARGFRGGGGIPRQRRHLACALPRGGRCRHDRGQPHARAHGAAADRCRVVRPAHGEAVVQRPHSRGATRNRSLQRRLSSG